MTDVAKLKQLLDEKVKVYNTPSFIKNDPITIPHSYTHKQDIEIAGLFSATLAWGNRTTIINSCRKLMQLMDNAPYDFVTQHNETDLRSFLQFVHRTFKATDLLYFISFLRRHYAVSNTLEDAFVPGARYTEVNTGAALIHYHNYFFAEEHPERTRKHVATPVRNSACKRLNMYLRWMVRKDRQGVDFGIWKKIKPHQLICPLDVHVARVAYRLNLIPTEKADWKNAVALTEQLKQLNPADPAVYDYALFGLGAEERF